MPLDSRDKRASALAIGLRGGPLPGPDAGLPDQADKQQLAAVYRGVLARTLEAGEDRASMLGLDLPFGFPLPIPGDQIHQAERQQLAYSYRGILAQTASMTDKLASMLGLGLPFGFPLPLPDMLSPSQRDRQQLANSYAGILAGAASGGITDATLIQNEVTEQATSSTVVGTVEAIGGGSPLGFTLLDDAGGAFSIGAASGVVTVANGALLDYEASPANKSITVQISDGGTPFVKAFTIIVLDAPGPNDITMDNQTVGEQADDGTLVGTASGVGGIQPYSYGFTVGGNPSNLFAIDSSTGEVTVAQGSPLDDEASPSPQITIEVTDSEGKSFAKSFTITVVGVSGQIIQMQDGTPDALVTALGQVTENDAIIQWPAGSNTYNWNATVTIAANYPFRVHLRGADFTPGNAYLTVDPANAAAMNAARDVFQPLTVLSSVNAGGNGVSPFISIERGGCTVSRLWGLGRIGSADRFLTVTDLTDQVVYWCRMENMGAGGIRTGSDGVDVSPGRSLFTDNWFRNTPSTIAGVLLWWSEQNSLYNSIDIANYRGTFNMPYIQRSVFESCGHAVDWTRNGIGVMRQTRHSVHNSFASPQMRVHGVWWFGTDCSQVDSGRYYEVYDCVHWADNNTWRFSEIKGGDGIVADCTADDTASVGGFMQFNYESFQRSPTIHDSPPGCNIDCGDVSYPEFAQTRSLYIDNCTYKGQAVSNTHGVEGICSALTQVGTDYFFGAHPTWVKPGAHPLMPSDITS